jgi:hypothetical protein
LSGKPAGTHNNYREGIHLAGFIYFVLSTVIAALLAYKAEIGEWIKRQKRKIGEWHTRYKRKGRHRK